MSLVIAVDKSRRLASKVKFKTYKGIHFARFFQNKLFPKLKDGRHLVIIVMYNCRIHNEKNVLNVLHNAHQAPLSLPASTPHLNVSERVFSAMSKGWSRKTRPKSVRWQGLIQRSLLQSVTAAKVAGWLEEVQAKVSN